MVLFVLIMENGDLQNGKSVTYSFRDSGII